MKFKVHKQNLTEALSKSLPDWLKPLALKLYSGDYGSDINYYIPKMGDDANLLGANTTNRNEVKRGIYRSKYKDRPWFDPSAIDVKGIDLLNNVGDINFAEADFIHKIPTAQELLSPTSTKFWFIKGDWSSLPNDDDCPFNYNNYDRVWIPNVNNANFFKETAPTTIAYEAIIPYITDAVYVDMDDTKTWISTVRGSKTKPDYGVERYKGVPSKHRDKSGYKITNPSKYAQILYKNRKANYAEAIEKLYQDIIDIGEIINENVYPNLKDFGTIEGYSASDMLSQYSQIVQYYEYIIESIKIDDIDGAINSLTACIQKVSQLRRLLKKTAPVFLDW